MNKHLQAVREFHAAFSLPQAEHGEDRHLSDMDTVMRQALLMERGSAVLTAIKVGEMAEILGRLTELAYYAVGGIAQRGGEVLERPVLWRHDGSVISIMRLLSEKIHNCTSGETLNYSELYCACRHLAGSFLNADFDKAFQVVHNSFMAAANQGGSFADIGAIRHSAHYKAPDFNDCLYE